MAAATVLVGGDGCAMMVVGSVIALMARGAIGNICRAGPGDGFAIGGMA
jgi:hypothetical protein